MTPDLLTTTAAVWMLVAVTAAGIAVLPWTDVELRAVGRAFAALPGLLRARPSLAVRPVAA